MDELTRMLTEKTCSLDCILQIDGNPGVNGYPEKDRKRPVHEFLTDLAKYYTLVYGHVKTCDKCRSNEVLRRYLNRRTELKRFSGTTSNGLVKLALKYERMEENPANPLLVDEFYVRSANWELILQRDLTEEQLIRAMRYCWIKWNVSANDGYHTLHKVKFVPRTIAVSKYSPYNALVQLYVSKGGGEFPPEEELENLFIAAEVMSC